ncbi:Uncharacterised protein [Mycobacterium tuberculosis]|uniref:Uncharacterized protein n=1 Tax=Mycobacterium tuberculosis TaxID=1773 RepID=A0A655F1C5_MYCTX|nr:Uncharacterised protein [Mycobacterium tuberculosis]CKV04789.1 Uncharacterised protein [Mycobacterium tuberculosis]CNV44843.1 Uncharacterised protein [Mycobacterium tuberculosis]
MTTAADHQIGPREQLGLAAQPGHRPGRHRQVGSAQTRHHQARSRRHRLTRRQRLQRDLRQSGGPGQRGGRRHDHHRPGAGGDGQHPIGRLEMQRAHHDGLGRPVRAGNLERGQRGDQPAQRPGIAGRQSDLDPNGGTLAQPGTPGPPRQRSHGGIAQPAADTGACSQSAADRRQSLRRQVQRMRVEFHPRDP